MAELFETIQAKTRLSNEKLELARRLIERANELPDDDKAREALEAEAKKLIEEANALTQSATEQVGLFRKPKGRVL